MIARKLIDNSLKRNYQLDTEFGTQIFFKKLFNFFTDKKSYFNNI